MVLLRAIGGFYAFFYEPRTDVEMSETFGQSGRIEKE